MSRAHTILCRPIARTAAAAAVAMAVAQEQAAAAMAARGGEATDSAEQGNVRDAMKQSGG